MLICCCKQKSREIWIGKMALAAEVERVSMQFQTIGVHICWLQVYWLKLDLCIRINQQILKAYVIIDSSLYRLDCINCINIHTTEKFVLFSFLHFSAVSREYVSYSVSNEFVLWMENHIFYFREGANVCQLHKLN